MFQRVMSAGTLASDRDTYLLLVEYTMWSKDLYVPMTQRVMSEETSVSDRHQSPGILHDVVRALVCLHVPKSYVCRSFCF